ncbi:MAG: CDP-alcohol phosphatidyltransferase family protein [Dehalococcoidia bacterium]|nr:CDP-alcohol phosphatidyltransferase family protein [Dehalococcoidia bacterium]
MKRTLHPLEKASDGPVALLINRPISRLISAPLARVGVTPNQATFLALAVGAGATAALALRVWWAGGLLLQLSSVLSGVDGEVARRTGRESRYGDFLDTTVDRFVEYAALIGIAVGLSDAWDEWAWIVGLLAVGGTFMLTGASEKYRSTMHENYPKRQLEPLFAYLVSGRDVRVCLLMLAAFAATWNVDVMFWAMVALAALLHANFLWRVILLRTRLVP